MKRSCERAAHTLACWAVIGATSACSGEQGAGFDLGDAGVDLATLEQEIVGGINAAVRSSFDATGSGSCWA